jgi:hypothetical protein
MKMPNMNAVTKQASAESEDARRSLELVERMEIAKDPELRTAVGWVAEVKDRLNAVEDRRKKIVEPLKEALSEVDALFKPALDLLKSAEKTIKGKVSDYTDQQTAKRHKLLSAAGDANDSAKTEKLIAEADEYNLPKVPGMSLRHSIDIEVFDPEKAMLWCVENERWDLLQVNVKALKALAKAEGSPMPAGVLVTPKTTVAITVDKVERPS